MRRKATEGRNSAMRLKLIGDIKISSGQSLLRRLFVWELNRKSVLEVFEVNFKKNV